jgi:glycine/D-amino acid oxidase-like deaminating enzyme
VDLKSRYPYWAVKNGLMRAFPPLQQDLRCQMAVVGGGITGALIANELNEHGFEVAVIEQRDVGWGSTAASTALLQYEIDTSLVDLAKQYGEQPAVLAYRACAEAIGQLRELAGEIRDVDFAMQQSLYYASRFWHAGALREECRLRARHGFQVDLLEADELAQRYRIQAPCAILSHLAARVDPYRLAHRVLARLLRRGGQVFDRSRIEAIEPRARGVRLRTADGMAVHCEHLVMAAGYASQGWLDQKLASNRSSYAFITDPIAGDALEHLADTLVWESARPYLYLRSTGDGRLLVGGEDDAVDIPARRDARVGSKARRLAARVQRMFPQLPLQPAFSWAGTFAETCDGLPYFGIHPQYGSRVHFAMAYGGNGITYSMIGARLLRASLQRRSHPLAKLFSFTRT